MKINFANIYLPLKLQKAYTYGFYDNQNIQIGDIVLVSLGNKNMYGIVSEIVDTIDFDASKLKFIIEKVQDIPSLSENLLLFLQKLSNYYVCNFGNVLKLAINVAGFDFNKVEHLVGLNPLFNKKITINKGRANIIEALANKDYLEKKYLANIAGVSIGVINTLIKENFLELKTQSLYSNFQQNLYYQPLELSCDQQKISQDILNFYQDKKFAFCVSLLQGVPGAGKTEVYFEVLTQVLKQNKQVLIMLPEIALSTQIMQRFEERFNVKPYVWHSGITKQVKKDAWVNAGTGNLKVIIGARSSLFLPFKNLGLIIVDEEHDSSYKQEEGVIYNARDMAVMRAKLHNIPIMLASATPSLESLHNAQKNKYQLFKLQGRFNKHQMPQFKVVDMREEALAKGHYVSKVFEKQIQENLNAKEQSLIFINKRGYCNTSLCKSCGEKVLCVNCDIPLVEHRQKNSLLCHYCGYSIAITKVCSSCEGEVISFGFGIEKIFEEVQDKFKDAKIALLSSDTLTTHNKAVEMLEDINNNKYDILIGTQIISKGYHFPNLTFVGILDGDYMYNLDLKSSEKSWQLLYQVSGRSGRGEKAGKVAIQTYNPNSSLIESLVSQNYENFIQNELNNRQNLNFPPFGKLAGVIVSSKNKVDLENYCKYLQQISPHSSNQYSILGPIDAPIAFLRGFYRKRFLVKTNINVNIQKLLKHWIDNNNLYNIKLQIDVDPINFY